MKTKIIAFLMLVVLIISSFSGCITFIRENIINPDKTHTRDKEKFTHGDWVIIHRDNNTCSIYDLSEEGHKKEVLVVPEYIDGKKVKKFDVYTASEWGARQLSSENLEKLYFYKYMYFSEVFVWTDEIDIFIMYSPEEFYDNSDYLPENAGSLLYFRSNESKLLEGMYPMKYFANVSYYYNYENSPNDGYYWIDDYDGEIIKHKPENPTREGYEFAGWYKEPECINAWDFENDIIPKKIFIDGITDYLIMENYDYKETCLYAKWNKL